MSGGTGTDVRRCLGNYLVLGLVPQIIHRGAASKGATSGAGKTPEIAISSWIGRRIGSPMENACEAAADLANDRVQALALFDVSRETSARLDRFVNLLLAWQSHTNLISRSSVRWLWTRHVADSLQLLELAKPPPSKAPVWLDLGSGGGFPGIVIGCALADIPGACVHLIESTAKKAAFLREAVRETGAPGIVHAGRIEAVGPKLGREVDFITARALAPLPELCALIAPILKKGAQALLLKGQDLDTELTKATKYWNIEAEIVPSKTSPTGRILIMRRLSKRKKF
jgi:16S rRNA (guanine527-N7)-methyltransferase